jgi:hypothetical protein
MTSERTDMEQRSWILALVTRVTGYGVLALGIGDPRGAVIVCGSALVLEGLLAEVDR